jgi:hypothetical protein
MTAAESPLGGATEAATIAQKARIMEAVEARILAVCIFEIKMYKYRKSDQL